MKNVLSAIGLLALSLAFASVGQAATIQQFDFGTGTDSLQGATGFLRFEAVDADTTKVTWGMDTTGFHDAEAVSTGHTDLLDVSFKIPGITGADLMDPTVGSLNFPSNVNNAGCAAGSPASFVCLSLASPIDVTVDQTIEVGFLVEGPLDFGGEISYRGRFGPANGWVISESTTSPPIPEPTAIAVFVLGLAIVGSTARRGAARVARLAPRR